MPFHPRPFRRLTVLAVCAGLCASATLATAADTAATDGLPAATRARIDAAASEVLQLTGVPGTSIAVVRDGRTVYAKAYGFARLEPQQPADPAMRYEIGSISKQFLVAGLLLLQQEGKLSLDDKVAKYLPDLTRADDITIRQLLTHTSGYQDCCPQDYAIPDWLQPVTAEAYIERWGHKPLDYEPGTRYQYSNTGYTIAGRIVEKVSGQPLFEFLQQRIFTPLQMTSVYNADALPPAPDAPTGYRRLALGPPRVSPGTGAGWSFGSGGLAMTAADLARWDISFMNRSLLSEPSYRAMVSDTLLANGVATGYGLGVDVKFENQRYTVEHGGEELGFTAHNTVYPDDRTAIVVLVNQDASPASELLSEKISKILFEQAQTQDDAKTAQARAIFVGLQQGRIDRSLFTPDANFYFSDEALGDFKASLGPLGAPESFEQTRSRLRGGMTGRRYEAKFGKRTLRVSTYEMPDGKIEQFQVAAKD